MNICFIAGIILSEISLDFIYNNKKHISVINFYLKTASGFCACQNQIIQICAYDSIADIILKKYKKGNFIKITGHLNSNFIEADDIYM